MGSLTIRRRDTRVYLLNNDTGAGLEMDDWRVAIEFGQTLAYQARGVLGAYKHPITRSVTVWREDHSDGTADEIIEIAGHLFAVIPAAAAVEIGYGIVGQARLIEEEAKAEEIAMNQAIILRSGALPFGLTNHPAIQWMAGIEARFNTKLRRYLRGGVKHKTHVGVPRVRRSED